MATPAEILDRHRRGELSAEMALVELVTLVESVEVIDGHIGGSAELRAAFDAHRPGLQRIVHMLRSGLDLPDDAPSIEEGIARARALFDWSVTQSEASSVAFHSLGSEALLERATAEIVQLLDERGLVAPDRRVLQIGCGIGRFEAALSSRVAEAHGIDVSPNMIAAARRRCAGLSNVTLEVSSGRDLAMYGDERMDLVYAVDSFPYVVQAGAELVRAYVAEARRVLVPGGAFVVLGMSYRGLDVDRAELTTLARELDLAIVTLGETPLSLWSGGYFELRKP